MIAGAVKAFPSATSGAEHAHYVTLSVEVAASRSAQVLRCWLPSMHREQMAARSKLVYRMMPLFLRPPRADLVTGAMQERSSRLRLGACRVMLLSGCAGA